MKKIVNGLLYDTENSELIYCDESSKRRWYMTQNRNFYILFMTGEIQPITEQGAKDKLGENDVGKYIEIFGLPEEA